MKKLLLALLISASAFSQDFGFQQDIYINAFVDPTLNDNGYQIGASVTIEGKQKYSFFGRFAELSISHYSQLEPAYSDISIAYGGTADIGRFKLFAGLKLVGVIWREGEDQLAPLAGAISKLQYQITENINIGGMLWIDYRGDLSNNMLRENTGFYISYKF